MSLHLFNNVRGTTCTACRMQSITRLVAPQCSVHLACTREEHTPGCCILHDILHPSAVACARREHTPACTVHTTEAQSLQSRKH